MASEVNPPVAKGDVAGAQRASAGRKWSRLAIVIGIVVIALGIVWWWRK
jgi:hypothetical protein